MNLFVKIFLWFLAAIALMVGVVVLLNWTVQTEPVVSRWRISVRNQTNIYGETAAQIFNNQGEPGLLAFLERIRAAETISEVDLIGPNGKGWLAERGSRETHRRLVRKALASNGIDIENQTDRALSARQVTLGNGERYVLIVRWERPRMVSFFGESPFRYIRY